MNRWQLYQYTASLITDPDLVAYVNAGWEIIAVVPCDERYTFFLRRYITEPPTESR